MPVNTEGFAELVGQIEKMAHRLNTDEEGAPTTKRILQAAAQPICWMVTTPENMVLPLIPVKM